MTQLGDRIAVQCDGVLYTDTVQSVTYHSPEPEIVRQLSWWQRIIRTLTPPHRRKSLVIRPSKPETITLSTGGGGSAALERTKRLMASVVESMDVLTKPGTAP